MYDGNEEVCRSLKKVRKRDPFMDRRSGEDRRKVYSLDYFNNGGAERRRGAERRSISERRADCVRVSQWSSVCPNYEEKEFVEGRIDL